MALEQVKLTVPEIAKMAKNGPIILTRKGKPLVSVKNLSTSDWERIALASNERFQTIIEESRRSYREKGGKPLEEFQRELGLPLKRLKQRRGKKKRAE